MAKKLFVLALLSFLILLLGAFSWWRLAIQPVNPRADQEQIFVIPPGQSGQTIAQRLKKSGLIKSSLAFKLLVDRKNLGQKLQAGDFRLSPAMDLNMILDNLAHGTLDFWITFPEGLRVEEYAERLSEKAEFDVQDFILSAKSYEGKLFPDTYLIPRQASADDIVAILTDTFAKKSPTQDERIIIIASLVEREARHPQDRTLVSSVIHNRLKLGMALQIDATVQYSLGQPGNWWPKNLTKEKLQTQSAYNTYLRPGLPPKPIANPGLESLKAAMDPAETDYLYYVSDASGNNHYASNLEEHNANITQYLH